MCAFMCFQMLQVNERTIWESGDAEFCIVRAVPGYKTIDRKRNRHVRLRLELQTAVRSVMSQVIVRIPERVPE
jgi:hypothetical protein